MDSKVMNEAMNGSRDSPTNNVRPPNPENPEELQLLKPTSSNTLLPVNTIPKPTKVLKQTLSVIQEDVRVIPNVPNRNMFYD
jgi:hypothetical protein